MPGRHQPGRPSSPWSVDPDLIAGMRREQARRALSSGDARAALVEAEELLDDHPGDVAALDVVGQAALVLGDAPMAAQALAQRTAGGCDDADVWTLLGLASLHAADLQAAGRALDRSLSIDESQPLAWHLRGRLRDQLGEDSAADHARAAALDPVRFPLPRQLPDATWDEALAQALDDLDPVVAAACRALDLRWQEQPASADLLPGTSPLAPLLARTDDTGALREVLLFRRNIGWPPASRDELAARISDALDLLARAWTSPAQAR